MVAQSLPSSLARRRLTADQYQRMIRSGIIREGEKVELLDGELIQMATQGGPHIAGGGRLTNWFAPRIAGRATMLAQGAMRLSAHSEPEPDLVLYRFRPDFWNGAVPPAADALLVIEVSITSRRYDRDVKMPRYAAADIPEAWLVDTQRRRLTVYREPSSEGYRQVILPTHGAIVSPHAFPDFELRWEDIFGAT
jgi:Uma2 family endonuclease